MNIQECSIERGFNFEVHLEEESFDCFVKGNGKIIDQLNYFKLEAGAGPKLIFTLKGFKTDAAGRLIRNGQGDVVRFSRAFIVEPKECTENRLLLEVEKEIQGNNNDQA